MHFRNTFARSLVALFALTLVMNAAVFARYNDDDRMDAWVSVGKMIKFIEMGDQPDTERAGNDAIGSLDKAIDKETDSGKKDKLRDAQTQVREALSNAARGAWPEADGAANKAQKLIEDAK